MKSKTEPRRKRAMRRARAVSRRTKNKIVALTPANMPPIQVPAPSDVAVLQALMLEYQRIKEEIQRHALLAQERADSGNDIGDDASQVSEVSKNLALKNHLERLLAQIEAAIHRIEKGVYGMCERCGELINPDRLAALPYATTCFGCAKVSLHAI